MKLDKKAKATTIITTFFKYFILIFFVFWTLVPLFSCFVTAFKNPEEYQNSSVMMFPKHWALENFANAFNLAHMGRAFINSAIVLISVLAGSILISSQLAYILNRFRFPGNSLIRKLFLFATLLPGVAMQVAVYSIMGKLGFINHLYGYIIMMMGTDVISIYIFIQFMENISYSLDESAIIDGASYFTIYWKIILPLLKPATITSMILKGVSCYNEYYSANLYLQDTKLRTVAISLYTFTGPLGNQYNLICAGVIISIIPALIIFLFCQKQIYAGITNGAVKG
ncbi:MAG: carbohydrate ABC transporter permease [Treponema sp.]|nr:carbohydrate ABC transporter permease [Treponema sp.]